MVDLIIMGETRTHGSPSKRRIGVWERGDVVQEYPGGTLTEPPHKTSPFIAVRVSDGVLGELSVITAKRYHPTEKDKHGEARPSGRRAGKLTKSFVDSLSRDEINIVTKAQLLSQSRLK